MRMTSVRPGQAVLAAVAAGALLLSACASDDDDVAATASTAGPASTTPATTAPSTTTTTPPVTEPSPVAWQQVDVGAVAPPPRSGAVLVATPDGELWLHGGHVDREPMGDLWRFDGTSWTEVVADGGPTPRSEHAAVWDAERSRLVVGLGEGQPGDVFDDVWAFDPAAGTWAQVASGGPAARYGACAVLDGSGRMVMTHGFSSTTRFDDTWAFDLATDTWAEVTPAEGPRPSARCLHACGYDPDADEVVLFGGRNDDDPYLDDTWRLGAGGWRQLDDAGPAARSRSRGAFTTDFLVVGGEGDAGLVGDAWTLGASGWAPAPPGAPADRQAPAVAEAGGVVWLFGGVGDAGPLADLWRYG